MNVVARIVEGPVTADKQTRALQPHGQEADGSGSVGATLCFQGIVRRRETDHHTGVDRDLLALDYQTYDPMAERELLALARDVAARHGLASLTALHSRGRVGVGEVSFMLRVDSAHRAEALAAIAEFIDRLKQDVPIWKRFLWE